jgi:glycosyltransferase involved in cell wall biosynthesis
MPAQRLQSCDAKKTGMNHVLYIAPFAKGTGYAQAAHDYMLAMHRAGISLEIQPIIECDLDDLEERYAELIPLVRGTPGHQPRPPTHVIVHTVPAHAYRFVEGLAPDVYRIALTTWETDQMPREIAGTLDDFFDMVIVPSEFCGRAIDPLLDKIRIVPHCFDDSHWPLGPGGGPGGGADDGGPGGGPYSFYSILGWSERKNPIGLLKAYLSEFSVADNVVLRLKLSAVNEDDVASLIAASGIPRDELPKIDFITDYFDHEDMVDLHHESSCFVTAARGEGWNLPAFEAALVGNPVISPEWGGQREYLRHYNNFISIPVQLTPAICPPEPGDRIEVAGVALRALSVKQPTGITARQRWGEPDLYALGKAMRGCYERPPLISAATRAGMRSDFSRLYNYVTIGQTIARLIENNARI